MCSVCQGRKSKVVLLWFEFYNTPVQNNPLVLWDSALCVAVIDIVLISDGYLARWLTGRLFPLLLLSSNLHMQR
jgi:hypothetical protein